jgi:leucyl/phenylalanyl-tRNA--protein transferase
MNEEFRIAVISPDDPPTAFPDANAENLLATGGLLAIGGDLTPERLLAAYRRGIFPWYEEGQPILWWNPDPRAVIAVDSFHVSRRLRRKMRQGHFSYSADQDCHRVIGECRRRRLDEGTWITREMERAYGQLHEMGHVHSMEVHRDGDMVGGIYGVLIGGMFFGESMYSARADASKIALAALCKHLAERGGTLIDCQVPSPHLETLGMQLIPRIDFQSAVARMTGIQTSLGWHQTQRCCSELIA